MTDLESAPVTRLGDYVRERRVALGMTVTDLARTAGLSKSEVSSLESGRIKLPSPAKRRALASALRVRHVDLLIAAGELAADELSTIERTASVAGDELDMLLDGLSPEARQQWATALRSFVKQQEATERQRLTPSETRAARGPAGRR